jgi:hypothetical protein
MQSTHFETSFDLSQTGYEGLKFILICGLIGILCCIVAYLLKKRGLANNYKIVFVPAFLTLFFLYAGLYRYPTYSYLKHLQDTQGYQTVEGHVANFQKMQKSPYNNNLMEQEYFTVNNIPFYYEPYKTAGFHTMAIHGGPMREGLYVRMSYAFIDKCHGNEIIKLEIQKE